MSDLTTALNAARAQQGLEPLRKDSRLSAAAMGWSAEMAKTKTLTHGDFATRIWHIYNNTAAGEDIAEGPADAEGVVALWMNSPPHRANILGGYNLVGTGKATAADGSEYWCADFDNLPGGETA